MDQTWKSKQCRSIETKEKKKHTLIRNKRNSLLTCRIAVKNPCGLKKPVIQNTLNLRILLFRINSNRFVGGKLLFSNELVETRDTSSYLHQNQQRDYIEPTFGNHSPSVYPLETMYGIVHYAPAAQCTKIRVWLIPTKSVNGGNRNCEWHHNWRVWDWFSSTFYQITKRKRGALCKYSLSLSLFSHKCIFNDKFNEMLVVRVACLLACMDDITTIFAHTSFASIILLQIRCYCLVNEILPQPNHRMLLRICPT